MDWLGICLIKNEKMTDKDDKVMNLMNKTERAMNLMIINESRGNFI